MELIPDDIDFNAYKEEPEKHKVRAASDFMQATIDAFHLPSNSALVAKPLWDKCQGKIAFRTGEVSLWAGVNGHGKSMFLSQISLDLMSQEERVLVLSFEMQPVRQMQRMCRQGYAGGDPSVEFIKAFSGWTDGRLWLYDHNGSIEWPKVMAVMRYAREKFGITQFVIDSMMKCVKGEDDYNGQKDFVNDLCAFAQSRSVHVHLVHHVRKGESEFKAPGKFDVRGATSITDQVDNVFIVWRNKKAERGEGKDATEPNTFLLCEKQRNGEWEGKLGFWFDPDSMQYFERIDAKPIRYNLRAKHGYRAGIE
jgi:twinkle protein